MRALLEEFVNLSHRLRDVDDETDAIKKRLAEIEPLLLEEFGLAGIQNVNCDGLTVFVKREKYVNKKSVQDGVTTELLLERLKENGFSDLCHESYSASALKARMLELLENECDIPRGVAECLNISEGIKLGTRKSG